LIWVLLTSKRTKKEDFFNCRKKLSKEFEFEFEFEI
jgi:hypothetical protein